MIAGLQARAEHHPAAPDPADVLVPSGRDRVTLDVGTEVVTGPDPEETLVRATRGTMAEALLTVEARPAGACPLVRLESPAAGDQVWDYGTPIVATIQSDTLESWTLSSRMIGDGAWIELASEGPLPPATPKNSETIALFDPTLLLNGIHELKLEATDAGGPCGVTSYVVVMGQQKVGHFTVSFVDLTIPVAGLPIQVIRTHDSRDRRLGDFGHGWRLGYSDVRLEKSGIEGQGFEYTQSGSSWCVEPTRPKRVTVTFPSGRVHEFEPVYSTMPGAIRPCQFGWPPTAGGWVMYRPVGFTRGKLRVIEPDPPPPPPSLEPNFVYLVDGELWPCEEGSGTCATWQSSDLELTTEDGTRYKLREDAAGKWKLDEVRDRNDNTVTFDATGIHSSHGPDVLVERDPGDGRVLWIEDPNGHRMLYGYGTALDLVSFQDRQQVGTCQAG